MMSREFNTIELFAGCGGLVEGFEREGSYQTLACVEWEKAPCENLTRRLATKWHHKNAESEVICFDIQRTRELIHGFDDAVYGQHDGLDALVAGRSVDMVIGGPPCQAYSIAGRVRDANGMRDDYRNYLFESYIRIVKHYRPKLFLFENVQGILSASPDGTPIIKKIQKEFAEAGYMIKNDIHDALFDLTEYGVPQKRKRIIILGVSQQIYGENAAAMIRDFYEEIMPSFRTQRHTVRDAIADLPPLYPLEQETKRNGQKASHQECTQPDIYNHEPRFHSKRDQKIFSMLADDIAKKQFRYTDADTLKDLYFKMTGHHSNVHKYYVLRWDEPSNTIPAHLYKDGLRHIHPDPAQARSITVREAARLQTFDDDYIFLGSRMNQYKMIGNAVPPRFSHILAKAVKVLLNKSRE